MSTTTLRRFHNRRHPNWSSLETNDDDNKDTMSGVACLSCMRLLCILASTSLPVHHILAFPSSSLNSLERGPATSDARTIPISRLPFSSGNCLSTAVINDKETSRRDDARLFLETTVTTTTTIEESNGWRQQQ
jgi:hypothetical protein